MFQQNYYNFQTQTKFKNHNNQEKGKTDGFYFLNTYCQGGNIIKFLCIFQKCKKNAVMCEHSTCICKQQHIHPITLITQPELIYREIKNKIDSNSPLLNFINRILSEMIDWIYQFQDQMNFLGLEDQEIQFYTKKCDNFDSLNKMNGAYIHRIINAIKKTKSTQQQRSISSVKLHIQQYWHTVSEKIKSLIKQVQKIAQTRFPSLSSRIKSFQNKQYQIKPLQKKIKVQEKNSYNLLNISLIVNSQNQFTDLLSFLPCKSSIKSFRLLYRASEESFSSNRYRTLCYDKSHTLTIVQTSQYKKIGGFTPFKLAGVHNQFKQDQTGTSCIFSITNNEKFNLLSKKMAFQIQQKGEFVPIFGNGDLVIRSNSLNQKGSFIFGNTKGSYLSLNQEFQNYDKFRKRFTGSHQKKFSVKQWEVYQVIYSPIIMSQN